MAKTNIPKMIDASKGSLKELMLENVNTLAEKMIAYVMSNYKDATDSQKVNSTKGLKDKSFGISAYKKELLTAAAIIAGHAIDSARKEVPDKKSVELSEQNIDSLMLGEFEKLPPEIRKRLKNQIENLAETQKDDLEKVVLFQFSSSNESTDSADLIEYDLFESVDKWANGNSVDAGAGILAARTINESRQAFFFDDEVLDGIDAFVFENDDPETPICQDLVGTVFEAGDVGADRYTPPLHFNAVLHDQLISTSNGKKEVKDISVGDLVLTHKGRLRSVTEVMRKLEYKEYFIIKLENGKEISITEEHPVLTRRGWVSVGKLQLSDDIICEEDIKNV